MTTEIAINENVLDLAVSQTIRPLLDKGVLNNVKAEGFQHQKMLPTAQPCLTQDAIREEPTGNAWRAIGVGNWLLSQFELMYSKTFLNRCDKNKCREQLLDLLYGKGDLESRIRSFLSWSEVHVLEDTGKKTGINVTTISYLLAIVDPQRQAFCKPGVYKDAATALLGTAESEPVKRLLHANDFYRAALELFRDRYHLPFSDLFHVHIAFFMLRSYKDYHSWNELQQTTPPGKGDDTEARIIPPTEPDTDLERLIVSRKNVVLYGPPGTGKTYQALELVRKWKARHGADSVDQVTFHPSYSYEDFVEGYRPNAEGRFELRRGLLVQVCEKARAQLDRPFLLLIDEINRGDVARILGELITLIEADKRLESVATRLPYSQNPFWVPPNVHLLGTMNTADRSISLLDIAIRRRFCFIECRPDPDVFAQSQKHLRELDGISMARLLAALNARLLDVGIDRDRAVGHSYFMIASDDPNPLGVLRDRLRYDILPLIEEYCYADRTLIRRTLGDLVDAQGEVDHELLDDDERLKRALLAITEVL